ncbi:MAG: ABC transporter permease [Nitrospinaceae bacterium]|jgi:putative ABC transport system permease protein|tara:strand:+ start:1056 stop:2195 length:1140 start_codon:yes stop_codon:yes gene_type:complete
MTLGIMIGIASLTVIVAIGEGTKSKVLSRIASLGFGPESFSVYSGAGRLFFGRNRNVTSMTLQDADDIRAMPEVAIVVPRQRKRMRIINKKEFTSTRVYGVSPEWQPARQWKVVDGTFFNDMDMERKRKVIVLGATPAYNLFGEKDPIGKKIRVGQVFFEVIGLLKKKGLTESGYDPDNRALIPLTTSMSRLFRQAHLHSMKVVSIHPEMVQKTMEGVTQILRRNHGLSSLADDDFRFVTPEGIMQWVTESEQALNRMLFLVSTVSLLVGGVVIMNILLVSIRERIREIGVRRCFGARRSDITQQFLFESILVSLLGGLMGAILGWTLSTALRHFDFLPVKITLDPFLLAFIFSMIVGLIFGIYPARKAALLSPDETIR